MPYMTPEEMKRREALVNQLRNTAMNDTGKKTDWGRGLAHVLRQYQAGKGASALAAQTKENTNLSMQDMDALRTAMRNPEGSPAPDFSSMAITKGMDQGMVQGAQQNAISTPSLADTKFNTPRAQALAFELEMKNRDSAAERAQRMDELKYQRDTTLLKPTKRSLSFEQFPTLDADGNIVSVPVAFDKNSGELSQLENPALGGTTSSSRPPQTGSRGILPQNQLNGAAQAPTSATVGVGQFPYDNPEKVKERQAKQASKEKLTNMVTGIADNFLTLQEFGGAVEPEGGMSNIKNAVLGTETVNKYQEMSPFAGAASQLRRQILQTRPLLIAEIMSASDMSAKALDSNRELDFYLSALATPSLNYKSQVAALSLLNQKFGLGASIPQIDGLETAREELVRQAKAKVNSQMTPENIAHTAKKRGMTEDQVREMIAERLRNKWSGIVSEGLE